MKKKRTATIDRKTSETEIHLKLTIEGSGRYSISTGIRFFDHMLELFARHGAFDLNLHCKGDLDVDQHHTVEDVGIALGEASAVAPRTWSRPKSALVSSATCNPSSSKISSKASPAAPAPTSTSKRCTAARTTTRSRRSSKPSPALCASPARAIRN